VATPSKVNSASQDIHEEGLVSVQATLGSRQWVTLEESAEEVLCEVEEAMEIEYVCMYVHIQIL
jgi:hypothetical protein